MEIGEREPDGRMRCAGSGNVKVSREMGVDAGRELILNVGRAAVEKGERGGEWGGESRGESRGGW